MDNFWRAYFQRIFLLAVNISPIAILSCFPELLQKKFQQKTCMSTVWCWRLILIAQCICK